MGLLGGRRRGQLTRGPGTREAVKAGTSWLSGTC